jgi:hypothetical protein
MKITPVDDKNTLFIIEDILSEDTLNKMDGENLLDIPWVKQSWQEEWERRLLEPDMGSIFSDIEQEIDALRHEIGEAVGMKFTEINSRFWVDTEGFTVRPHIDNPGVKIALQIYLKDCENAGTTFYNLREEDVEIRDDGQRYHWNNRQPYPPVRYTFEGKKNTGYIMLNNMTQLHGVPITLGKDALRLSAYCGCKE